MSKVYFMDDRARALQDSLVAKMLHLFDEAGFASAITPGKTVAIKAHMGEFNNTAYIRPVYVRALVDKVKSLGGDPFVVETTTLPYLPTASRTNAHDLLKVVERNGFNSGTVGCPIIVGDGYLGNDDVRVDLPEGFILREQYVATAVALADSMIALSHFKGHPLGTYGGAIKNIGVGCVSKRGKYNLHMGGHLKYGLNARPYYPHLCKGSECPVSVLCNSVCPEDALKVTDHTLEYNREKCKGCFACLFVLGCGAVGFPEEFFEVSSAGLTDSALAVMKTFEKSKVGFINMAIDIAPWCDCVPFSDRAIAPNIGVFASFDPLAIDEACLEKVKASMGMPGSASEDKGVLSPGLPKFSACSPWNGASEQVQIKTAEKIGLGSRQYELVTLPQAENAVPYLFTTEPMGHKLGSQFKKRPVFPEEGFKRLEEVDIEEVR